MKGRYWRKAEWPDVAGSRPSAFAAGSRLASYMPSAKQEEGLARFVPMFIGIAVAVIVALSVAFYARSKNSDA
jgi:hypothetical protein